MPEVSTLGRESSLGYQVRRLRIFCQLSIQELADLAGVPCKHVDSFEHNLPLPLDSKRRILKELWSRKFKK
jgi:hypothetical protein